MRRITYWSLALVTIVSMMGCQQGGKGHSQGGLSKDSDAYYLQLVERNKEFYQAYAVDSFVQTSEQLHQYLKRQEGRKDKTFQLLRVQWLMARSVYYAALLGRPDSGLVYTDQAIHLLEQEKMDPDWRVLALTNRGDFYRQTGELDRSAESYLRALAIADSFQTSEDSKIAVSLGISTAFTFMADYSNSRKWFERCEQLLPIMKTPDRFIYYNNLGNDYYLQQQYKEALPCFEKAAALVKDDPDKTWDYYTARANIAEILINLKEGNQARTILQEVDSFSRKVNFGMLLYYIETSKIELALLEDKTAEALHMVEQDNTPEEMIPAAKVMRLKAVEQVWKKVGNYQKAYAAHQEMHALNDSIQTANVRMQMSVRLMEYEYDKRLLEQQQEIENGKMTNILAWALFVAALMAVVSMVVLYLLHRRKVRMQALVLRQQLIETRLRNARNQLSPHFIYNALNHEMLAQMDGKTVNFESLTQLLRRGLAMADTLETSLQEELAFVDYYVTIEGQQLGNDFVYEKRIEEGIDISQIKLPAMTIQIFAENAIKHGLRPMPFQEGKSRKLTISVSRKPNHPDATIVEVFDNGNGLEHGRMRKEQTGMRVVRQTIQLLNEQNAVPILFGIGNYHEKEEDGCRSWILLPDHYHF